MGSLKALVVDDSPTMRQVFIAALKQIPELSCIEAGDGAEGIRCLVKQPVDVVITDLQMPVMNGLAFINYLRHRPETQAVPILVITSVTAEEDRRKLLAAGVRGFLRKPVAAEDIVASVRSVLPGGDPKSMPQQPGGSG